MNESSIEKAKAKEKKETTGLRERFGEWIEQEVTEFKKKETEEKDLEIRQLRERLESIKVKELSEIQLKMFETFERFVVNKEPEEDFNWKVFQALRNEALEDLKEEPNNSKMVSINLISEKLEPLVIKQQQEEENR